MKSWEIKRAEERRSDKWYVLRWTVSEEIAAAINQFVTASEDVLLVQIEELRARIEELENKQ